MSPIPVPSKLDASQVLQHAFDDSTSRLRVDTEAVIIDGAIEVAINAENDSIAVSDGTNTLAINPDGSINVVDSGSSPIVFSNVDYYFNEAPSVLPGVETQIFALTATITDLNIIKIDASGNNIAKYILKIDGSPVMVKRSWWTGFNVCFEFEGISKGILLSTGSTLAVFVLHNSADLGNFETTVTTI